MKKLAFVLGLCSMSYALQAPYLISATALSDSSVQLTWRNNDVATTGFIIQRKDSTETSYKFVDSVKSATQLTYTDKNGLLPTTLYTYQVIAYSATEVSDTSNSAYVTMPRVAPYLMNTTAISRNSVTLSWLNKGKTTQGFIIQREDSTEKVYNLIDSIKSATILTYTDTNGLRPGTLYTYRIIAYDAMNVQDTSNSMQVTTNPDIFTKPGISVMSLYS